MCQLFNDLVNITCLSFVLYKREKWKHLLKSAGKIVFVNTYELKCYQSVFLYRKHSEVGISRYYNRILNGNFFYIPQEEQMV